MTDFRIKSSFFIHRKTKRLRRALGNNGIVALWTLWSFAAENHIDGILINMNADDIALDADWDGDPDLLVNTLLECGWLDKLEDGTYALHDWEEHQPYVSHAEERSEQARNAARKRWAKRGECQGNAPSCSSYADSIPSAYGQHTDSNADFEMSNAPSPDPSPSPIPSPSPNEISGEREISEEKDPPPIAPPLAGEGGCVDEPLPNQHSPKRKAERPEPPEFTAFYTAYPRKVGRPMALKSWLRIRPDPETTGAIMQGLEQWKQTWERRGDSGKQFIPYPATFLNQQRWKEVDEIDGRRSRSITEHWDSKAGGGWEPRNNWGENVPTDEELDSVLERVFGDMHHPPVQPGVGNL